MSLFDNLTIFDTIASPLNYIGGKYRLLSQILPLFPYEIDQFIDLFCGGCNVGINIEAHKVTFNDKNSTLIGLLKTFQQLPTSEIFDQVEQIIRRYNLSNSSEYGYEYYNANGADGLVNYNRESYLKMRADFNALTEKNNDYYIRLYVLIVFAFNNQIRFNQKGEYNLPVGKRDFNRQMQMKLSGFLERLHQGNYFFESRNFRNFDMSYLTESDFVYIDPPYLITCATYNEQGGWNDKDERDLLAFLDHLNQRNVRFALSNVLKSKGKENIILQEWLCRNEYTVHFLDFHYANSNYQTKDKTRSGDEVLIVNY